MQTVRQLLRNKPDVYSVGPDDTVFDALQVMAAHNVGAVMVFDGAELVGILSERDYARRGILYGHASKERIADIRLSVRRTPS